MRVCLLSKQYGPGGGSERYATELANGLGRRGHDVDVVSLADDTERPRAHDNVDVRYVARRRRWLVTLETLYYSVLARTNLEFEAYDVVHGTLMPASAISLSVHKPDVPLVLTSHGTSLGEVRSHHLDVPSDYLKRFLFHPMNVAMDAATTLRGDRVIAISQAAEAELRSTYPTSPGSLVRIPHGVDVSRFEPEAGGHPAPSPDRLTCLHVGRLVSRKRVGLAIEAIARADADCELLVAGTGPHRERLGRLAAEHGIQDDVHFLGFVPDDRLPALYSSSDAFLFLSRYEGFGLTFLEAMASGLPVVGTPVGGFRDVATDGKTALVVTPDVDAVAAGIDDLDTPSERVRIGKHARARATEFTWDEVAARVESVYEEVVTT